MWKINQLKYGLSILPMERPPAPQPSCYWHHPLEYEKLEGRSSAALSWKNHTGGLQATKICIGHHKEMNLPMRVPYNTSNKSWGSPQHSDQAVGHLSTGSRLGGVWLHGCWTFLSLLLGVRRLRDRRWRPHQSDFIATLKNPWQRHNILKDFRNVCRNEHAGCRNTAYHLSLGVARGT